MSKEDESMTHDQQLFSAFAGNLSPSARIVIVHDSDADGVTAGVVLLRALERLGFTTVLRIIPDRYRDAWSPPNRARVAESAPDALFILDLGIRNEAIVDGVATCFIDHHHPDGEPAGATVITAYDRKPIPNTSLLVYELCSAMVDVSDLDWIAAIGAISDLGERAPFDLLKTTREKYGGKDLRELSTLINAARRASIYEPEAAAQLLLEHQSPRSALTFGSPELARLQAAREEVNLELARGKKASPKFSGNVALVRVSSACQVHPLIAQIWRSRLPKYVVLVANDAYLPGRVNFSARSSGDNNALQFLRGIEIDSRGGSYAHGHDQATGGSLPIDAWNELLAKIGFSEEVFASHDPAQRRT